MTSLTAEEQLVSDLSEFYDDPLGYVMYCFPWDEESSISLVEMAPKYQERFGCVHGPDVWACEFLDELGVEIRKRKFDGKTPVDPIQFATVSGHGIGKSTLTAWLVKFILDTRPGSIGTVTAMTGEQLKAKTWAEIGRWHRMSLTSHWFDYTAGRGAMALMSNRLDKRGESMREKWKCTAQTCQKENSEAFAGQHAANATSFYIFDEASGIEDKIFEVRDGGLTDGHPMTFDFGNGTRKSGRFYEHCEGRRATRYIRRSIDSRTVKLTNKKLFQQWIDDNGIDSDLVKVRILGQFPNAGSVQFIPSNLVEEAMARELTADPAAPLIIGVDPAHYGDDESVLFPRIGYDCRSFPLERYRGLDGVQLAGKVIAMITFFRKLGLECSGLFIDATGIGASVTDQLRHLGYSPTRVMFGSKPTEAKTYRYKSDEMWGRMRDALDRLCLPATNEPNGMDLKMQLTQREFGYTLAGNKIHLEPKKDMKARLGGLGASPDLADALACTFAQDVAPRITVAGALARTQTIEHEYDPFEMKF